MHQITDRPRPRQSLRQRLGHRIVAWAAVAGWIAMPLMPVLALAFSWFHALP